VRDGAARRCRATVARGMRRRTGSGGAEERILFLQNKGRPSGYRCGYARVG
jgi:hypothetical protein